MKKKVDRESLDKSWKDVIQLQVIGTSHAKLDTNVYVKPKTRTNLSCICSL